MALSNTSEYLETLISAGADALSNLYYINFNSGLLTDTEKMAITVRASQLRLPSFTQGENKQDFMTTSVSLPRAEIQGKKEIGFQLRVDANYKLYKFLLDQMAATSIPDYGFAATEVPKESGATTKDFTIDVYAMKSAVTDVDQETATSGSLDPTSSYQKLYSFKYCWIKSIQRPNFSYDSANSQTVSVTIGFYDYEDPQNLLAK